jgi:two-component system sensor histidine kinase HydH
VRDHGSGLPAGLESRIFEPFVTTRTTGTGLGLAVTRRIAEMHGGSVSARNEQGGGALFEISLPA